LRQRYIAQLVEIKKDKSEKARAIPVSPFLICLRWPPMVAGMVILAFPMAALIIAGCKAVWMANTWTGFLGLGLVLVFVGIPVAAFYFICYLFFVLSEVELYRTLTRDIVRDPSKGCTAVVELLRQEKLINFWDDLIIRRRLLLKGLRYCYTRLGLCVHFDFLEREIASLKREYRSIKRTLRSLENKRTRRSREELLKRELVRIERKYVVLIRALPVPDSASTL
jgi:hypothetical protein